MGDLPPPIQKRMKRRDIEGGSRFITLSCQHRLPLLSNRKIADLFAERLAWARRKHRFELFAWVVMPEHAHLLVRPAAGASLETALKSLKLSVSTRVIARWRKMAPYMIKRIDDGDGSPRFWLSGGGFDRNVRSVGEFQREVRYIHRNPVARGLVASADLWRWSSVRWWMQQREGEVECDAPPGDRMDWEAWRGFK